MYLKLEDGAYLQLEDQSFFILEGNSAIIDLTVVYLISSDTNFTTIQGQCSHNATISLQADNQQATFSDITYDRNQLPLNTWSATVSNMQLGNNVITVTASL